MSTSPFSEELVLPARSWQLPVACWFWPSVVISSESLALTTPEPPGSEHVQLSVTLVLFQPLAFLAGVWPVKVICGSVLSMSTSPFSEELVLPARSSQLPVACWFSPSLVISSESLALRTPEPPGSEQVQLSVTSVLFQPFAFLAGVWPLKLICGSVLSMSTSPFSEEDRKPVG